jgi:hypothetical protein
VIRKVESASENNLYSDGTSGIVLTSVSNAAPGTLATGVELVKGPRAAAMIELIQQKH